MLKCNIMKSKSHVSFTNIRYTIFFKQNLKSVLIDLFFEAASQLRVELECNSH